ncbi:hypothetical protein [Calothrix sp. 336/3]|uniref:hypothetical protein n=1 Tax=Calothrix sp. 336/3 TaxID=1337936 RepID=UPI0004E33C17|nr:hypothetical protein [Calothrix sp. 336/3]AKG22791.1 hypothetical protein IJ00_17270 [Calothrix sp. 336/3]
MQGQLIHTSLLTDTDKCEMYLLLNNHFQGVQHSVFSQDLKEKNWVILLRDENTSHLKGFSTLLMYDRVFQGEKISVVYSGDTIVDPSAWSSSALSRTWISTVNMLRQEYTEGKLYWLLISGGYRTYRFLPLFWREFYPRYDMPTPNNMQQLIHILAGDRFGTNYHPQEGVVRFTHPHILRDKLHGIPEERLQDPHIRFFQQVNPGHIQGDELVCLTEISEENLTSAGRRIWFSKSLVVSQLSK